MQLADHVALITGSARGIGHAKARCLAQEGANIVIADINAAGAEEAAAVELLSAFGIKLASSRRDSSHTSDMTFNVYILREKYNK